MSIKVDTKGLELGLKKLEEKQKPVVKKAIESIGLEILRFAQNGVPHDTGLLTESATLEPGDWKQCTIGYNKVYAARLHEHPEYNFKKGRRGKYLELPIVENADVLNQFFASEMEALFA